MGICSCPGPNRSILSPSLGCPYHKGEPCDSSCLDRLFSKPEPWFIPPHGSSKLSA